MKHFPNLSLVRYADEIIVHCNREDESEAVLLAIKERMSVCEISLNKMKTIIVYCKTANRKLKFKTVKFDFLGFSFKLQMTKNGKLNKFFLGYNCSISRKSELKIGPHWHICKTAQSDTQPIPKAFGSKRAK
jgi:RNA-directed DNA polymerase